MDAFLFSALLMGFAGSFHCMGMCGPIALALPAGSSKNEFIAGRVIYNLGRITAYSLIGFVTGLAGYSATLAGLQKELSIISGVLIIVFVIFIAGSKKFAAAGSSLSLATASIKRKFKFLFGKKSLVSLYSIGLLNGILPCGLVYMAALASIASGSILKGISFMALFGAGTFPAMFAVSMLGPAMGAKWKKNMNKAAPYVAVAVGVFLIWRGVMVEQEACCSNEKSLVEIKFSH